MEIKFNKDGLVPAVAQDFETKEVLMLAYMTKEALDLTIKTGKATYYSRSRQSLWVKGETSGHFQHVKEIRYDCDCDTILLIVKQEGAACHTGNYSCFYRKIDGFKGEIENA
ncbi:MAG: phosphoribosyl-AMP cyclohydrolase [Clostridiales bacterium]|nr:phosphoribosyl-AMP cyclohydrolase [Clostridiales bacterium]